MRLQVLLPHRVLLDERVDKVVAKGPGGFFGLLEHHADLVCLLAPGILTYAAGGEEVHAALDQGVLVKNGGEVLISVRDGVAHRPLGRLKETLDEMFAVREEAEERAMRAIAKIEADFVRRLVELGRA